jgi:hypothetical protein
MLDVQEQESISTNFDIEFQAIEINYPEIVI